MNEEGIKKLAELSRLELTEAEVAEYAGEFSDILQYVDSLKGAVENSDDLILENSANRNVVRADETNKESGLHTDDLLESAPDSENGYIKVKKIL